MIEAVQSLAEAAVGLQPQAEPSASGGTAVVTNAAILLTDASASGAAETASLLSENTEGGAPLSLPASGAPFPPDWSGVEPDTNRLSAAEFLGRAAFARMEAASPPPPFPASGAVTNAEVLARGGREYVFWIPATNWSFSFGGTSPADGVYAACCGVLSFGSPVGLARPAGLPCPCETNALLAPLWGELDCTAGRSVLWRAATTTAIF